MTTLHLTGNYLSIINTLRTHMWTVNFQMFKLVLEKAEEPEIKCQHPLDHGKSKRVPEKTSTSALLTMPKPLTVWITRHCGKFWKRWEYQAPWPASWEICIQARKQQWEPVMEQWTIQNWERSTSGYILSSCLFNLHAQYIMGHAMLDESQSGIKFSGRNINKSRYADETTLMAESKGELCFRGRERASWRWKRGVKNLS